MKGHIDPVFGALIPGSRWAPSLSHLLRRDALLRLYRHLPVGTVLEIGCGAGRLLPDISSLGFKGRAIDSSSTAILEANISVDHFVLPFDVGPEIRSEDEGGYSIVMALEVLEHIEDDRSALTQWAKCLEPEGRMIVSVPAFAAKFGSSDDWAGHFRRYEYAELVEKLGVAGLEIERACCIGFPLGNALRPISNLISRRRVRDREQMSQSAATAESGVDRSAERQGLKLIHNGLGRALLRLAFYLQNLTVNRHWGTGWIIVAKRRRPGFDEDSQD